MARKPAAKPRAKKSAAKRRALSKKASSKKASSKKKSAARKPARDRIIAAALDLAAQEGWRRVSLRRIAETAGVSLAELCAQFSSKAAIIGGFLAAIDEQVLTGGDVDMDEPVRDRLFEVLMRRFDAMEPHRDGIDAVIRGSIGDTEAALCVLPRFLCSMGWMLEAAGVSSAGISGLLRTKGLAVITLGALWAWLGDDTPDRSRTMAALDRGLRRAEWLIGLARRGAAPAAESAD